MEILEKYDFEVQQVTKGRGVFIIVTDMGKLILKEYSGSGKYVEATSGILERLNEEGRIHTDSYIRNSDGEIISTALDESRYIVKRWYDCRDFDIRSVSDVSRAMSGLAILHNSLETQDCGDFKHEAGNPCDAMKKHNRELYKIKKFIIKKNYKTDFERLVIKSIDEYIDEGESAEKCCQDYLMRHSAGISLCHGNYNYHNVHFMDRDIVISNFEKMHRDYFIIDMYEMMRKLLEKYDWNIKLGHKLLADYDRERRITDSEISLLARMFSYPEKYWKIVNAYYNSKKSWMPVKNSEKLIKVIRQNRARWEFVATISG